MRINPKKIKFGRVFRIKLNENQKSRGYLNVKFYEYGLKALENGKIKLSHLNAITRLLKRLYKKNIGVRNNISLIIPVTKKPLETRMGKGKGARDHWECPIKKGMILLEIGNLPINQLNYGLKLVQNKLPMATKIVKIVY